MSLKFVATVAIISLLVTVGYAHYESTRSKG